MLRPALAPLLSIAVLLALAAGCGGTPDDRAASSDPTTTAPGTTSRAPSPTTAPPDTAPPPAPDPAADLLDAACDGRLEVSTVATLPAHLTSVSGLAASHRHPGVVWAVEDSFEPPVVTALGPDGAVLATVRLTGAPLMNLDWEALAVGPGPDGEPWVHVGDVGDNLGVRPHVRIHRFPEPELRDATLTPETVVAHHPEGRPDVEAMAVDPEGRTWLVELRGDAPAGVLLLGADGRLERRGELDLGGEQVTAIDLSADGSVLAVRTDRSLRLHPVPDGGDLLDALDAPPCATPELDERQGESVALLRDRPGVVTVSEDESGSPVELHLTAPAG